MGGGGGGWPPLKNNVGPEFIQLCMPCAEKMHLLTITVVNAFTVPVPVVRPTGMSSKSDSLMPQPVKKNEMGMQPSTLDHHNNPYQFSSDI